MFEIVKWFKNWFKDEEELATSILDDYLNDDDTNLVNLFLNNEGKLYISRSVAFYPWHFEVSKIAFIDKMTYRDESYRVYLYKHGEMYTTLIFKGKEIYPCASYPLDTVLYTVHYPGKEYISLQYNLASIDLINRYLAKSRVDR